MKNTFIGLDIGFNSIKLVELCREKAGLTLSKVIIEPCDITDSKNHGEEQLFDTVERLFAEHKIKAPSVVVSVSGQSVFTRFVKLPTLDRSKIDQIVQYEAQQQVPFPIDEVVWDYQLIGDWSDDGDMDETSVVLVACKKDFINRLVESLAKQKIYIDYIDTSPFALCNCIRFNEPSLEGCTLVLDIGAKSTDMVVLENDYTWVRSIPIAGFSITSAIAKEFKITFSEAEKLKLESAVILCGKGPMIGESSERLRVSRAISNVMSRLIAEISRSIGFYRTYSGGGGVRNILITGGCSNIENIEEFFTEKFNIPVRKVETIRNIDIAPEYEDIVSAHKSEIGNAIGLAMRKATKCFMEISLLPKRMATQREISRKKSYIIACFIVAAILMSTGIFYFNQWIGFSQSITTNLQADLEQMKSQQRKMDTAKQKVTGITAKLDKLESLQLERTYWNQLLLELQTILPKDCWLKRFSIIPSRGKTTQYQVQISGETTALLSEISAIKEVLEKSPFFKDVLIKSADDLNTMGAMRQDIRRFEMTCKLNK
ncbi:MAG: type IV pilus assembly protein PilM [Candidatus Auribacterota bacterium]|jgi:type IV pilus assembly protein PilM|nr:type IV pilus assembly protein PilM [Candidatus Auribacterota bacterium]